MPIIDPTVQALKDYEEGLTPLDANPYEPFSFPAEAWVKEMERLCALQEEQLECSP
jgi:hypothetical protein